MTLTPSKERRQSQLPVPSELVQERAVTPNPSFNVDFAVAPSSVRKLAEAISESLWNQHAVK
jgi:hypothetical protein